MTRYKLQGPFSTIVFNKQLLIIAFLSVIIVLQSLGVIYARQTRRLLHAKLQSLYRMRDELQVEWSKLLLEQGTWQADARVEKIAREQLGMVSPDKHNVITP